MVVAQEEQLLAGGDELLHPDPVVLELNRLQNQIKEKDRELGAAQAEIKALKAAEAFKDKALEELRNELQTLDEKLRANENFLEQKNLKINKLINEKKEALAAQFAAEATLRRVYADQKEDDDLPLESVIAPLESEIKILRNEVAALQEDKKALERLTKSKEAALLEAEKILKSALERVLIVEEVQNQNFELRRQIEICHEENKILEKSNRQKVMEVEKLSQTIKELEEAILAGGAAANTIRDYRRQISELHDEKRTLERELARVKVSANRVATVVANEWKDENDKVMPVKQWLEERRLLQAEMQKLRDKLAISERTAKAEAQLKDKFKLRIKILEEGLRQVPSLPINNPSAFCGSPGTEKSGNILGFITSNGEHKSRSTSQPRGSTIARNSIMPQPGERERAKINEDVKQASTLKTKHGSMEVMLKKCLWAPKSKLIDSSEKENKELKGNTDAEVHKISNAEEPNAETNNEGLGNEDSNTNIDDNEHMVSGFLYDRLQREVINLRKLSEAKNSSLEAKDQEIKLLMKKVDALTRAMEVESRKVKREAAAREKETVLAKTEATKSNRNMIGNKRGVSTA